MQGSVNGTKNFNPRAPRGARPEPERRQCLFPRISIHVPREGHDLRAPRLTHKKSGFQSTCPARGTTDIDGERGAVNAISIHVPREGHDYGADQGSLFGAISIHVPREGHDARMITAQSPSLPFQSTCPARGTTPYNSTAKAKKQISIHVPREGHDRCRPGRTAPKAPISIHVPREGHDTTSWRRSLRRSYFNPRAPRGARHHQLAAQPSPFLFQSTCPARGTTSAPSRLAGAAQYFNPRAPRGARQYASYISARPGAFQSLSLILISEPTRP